VSVDPERGVMVVNHNRFATYMQLLTRKAAQQMGLKPLPAYSEAKEVGAAVAQANTPYAAFPRFWLTPIGVPCIAPPYGLISAVDLHSGKLLWSRRLGTAQGVGPLGLKFPLPIPMGSPTHGGSLVTRSGVVFIGASADGRFRAFDLRSGRLLWQTRPPGGAGSTPIAYTVNGREYVVVMASGQPAIGSEPGTRMVAFALPQ
jgi:quinoprotein glucose dehydrogenase